VLGNYVDGVWIEDNKDNMFYRMYSAAINRGLEFKNKKEFSQKLVNVTKNSLKHASAEDEHYVSFNEEEMVMGDASPDEFPDWCQHDTRRVPGRSVHFKAAVHRRGAWEFPSMDFGMSSCAANCGNSC
jgi:hypothetical protein